MKEKKARVEDALHACRAAVEEGILPGGGVAVIRAAAKVLDGVRKKADNDDQRLGVISSAAPSRLLSSRFPRTPAWTARSSPRKSKRAPR